MKKIITLILTLLFVFNVFGCGSTSKDAVKDKPKQKVETKKPSQAELNAKLKQEAVRADFVELNSFPDKNKKKKVFLEGKIGGGIKPGVIGEFDIMTKEGGGDGGGYYTIKSFDPDHPIEEKDRDSMVKIWGVFEGKNDIGIPTISATIVEK